MPRFFMDTSAALSLHLLAPKLKNVESKALTTQIEQFTRVVHSISQRQYFFSDSVFITQNQLAVLQTTCDKLLVGADAEQLLGGEIDKLLVRIVDTMPKQALVA